MSNVFVTATKRKLRFTTTKGAVSVEDLWDLPLETLDRMAVALDITLGQSQKSFLTPTGTRRGSNDDNTRLEVLKVIMRTRQEEAEVAKARSQRTAQLAFLKELQAEKAIEGMKSMTAEQLAAQIKALEESE